MQNWMHIDTPWYITVHITVFSIPATKLSNGNSASTQPVNTRNPPSPYAPYLSVVTHLCTASERRVQQPQHYARARLHMASSLVPPAPPTCPPAPTPDPRGVTQFRHAGNTPWRSVAAVCGNPEGRGVYLPKRRSIGTIACRGWVQWSLSGHFALPVSEGGRR